MFLTEWFLSLFGTDNTLRLNTICADLAAEVYYKHLAIQACINLIANTLARSEFLTFEKGQEVQRENYYLFNVEPNQNTSSSKFWRGIVAKLVYDNECLVIQQNMKFYVADSFDKKEFAFYENVYRGITIKDYPLVTGFKESEVLHFELHNEKIRLVIDGLYKSYSKLIAASQAHYKKNYSKRGILELDAHYPQTETAQTALEDLLNNKFKRFFEAEGNAVLPLPKGMKYNELISSAAAKGSIEGRDIRAFIDDIFDFTAIAFQIPPQLLKGNVADTEKPVNNLLTFCVNPIAELITDEVNRKLYGKEKFLQKTYAKLDTSRIKAVDIEDIANALDIMFRCGVNSIDDNLRILGREPLNTSWSKARFVTKNYSPVEQVMKGEVNNGTSIK